MRPSFFSRSIFITGMLLTMAPPLLSSPVVRVSCNHYGLSVGNDFQHSLKITILKGKKTILSTRLMGPGEKAFVSRKLKKAEVKRMTVICEYDSEAHERDQRANLSHRVQRQNQLDKELAGAKRKIEDDLMIKLGAEAASNLETKSDDDGLTAFAKWLARGIGNTVKLVYSFSEFYNQYAYKTYASYAELFEDLAKAGKEAVWIKGLSAKLEREGIFTQKTNEYVIKAIVFYIQSMEEVHEKYERRKGAIEADFERTESEIAALRGDPNFRANHTYNAWAITIKPADFRTVTPCFAITFEPLTYGNALNAFWKSRPDNLMENKDGGSEYEWADGLVNRYLGGNIDFIISPEMRIGKRSYSRLMASVGYHRYAFQFDSLSFSLSNNFFSATPANPPAVILFEKNFQFEQQNVSLGLDWRFFLKKRVLFDLFGGMMQQSANLNLRPAEIPDGYVWARDQISISKTKRIPYGGVKLGMGGRRFHRASYLTVASTFFQSKNVDDSNYILTSLAENKRIDYASKNRWDVRFDVGFCVSF